MATAAKKKAAVKAAPVKKTRVRLAAEEATKPKGRVRLDDADDLPAGEIGEAASTYFSSLDKEGLQFVSAGAAIIDCMLGGGWCLGRVANIVGDKSAGKTLLAIEASANFHQTYPKGLIRYNESEAAFDEAYAEALGMPVDAVEFAERIDPSTGKHRMEDDKKITKPTRTVEDFFHDIEAFTKRVKKSGKPALYVLDSLDALSDDAEMKRDIDDGSYGANKAKKLGEAFRRLVEDLESAQVGLIVVSQLRDKIGVMFGEKQTRTGGRALDFYASHIVWLAEIGKIKRTMDKVERVIGVKVRARVKKNKVGLPFRECEYPILFGWGVDDLTANVEWLLEVGREALLREKVGMSKAGYDIRIRNLRDKGGEPVREVRAQLRELVAQEWQKIETGFLPKARKYG